MRYAFLAFYLLSILLAFKPGSAQADPPPLNGEMSRFSFADTPAELSQYFISTADGDDVPLTSFRGKIVVLSLWATWCGPCVMELPSLDRLQGALAGDDVVVIPVSIDRGGAHKALPFLERMNVHTVTPYFDRSNTLGRVLGASRIPMTVIIGKDGAEIGRYVGTADWDSADAVALMKYFAANGGDVARMEYVKAESRVAMTH